MNHSNQKWTILLRGVAGVVEIALFDKNGMRASRVFTNINQARSIDPLLVGWERAYGCETHLLFAHAFYQASDPIQSTLDEWAGSLISIRSPRLRAMDPRVLRRASQLAQLSYRPKIINDLKQNIALFTREAEFIAKTTGQIDLPRVRQIAGMRLELDGLYYQWAEGEII